MNNVSAIKLGGKIMVFVNGKKQTISKVKSPEFFDIIHKHIIDNNTQEILNIFDNFENKLFDYIKKYFKVENGDVIDCFHNEPNKFSKLIIRKGVEIMSTGEDVEPLYKLSKKIFFSSIDVSEQYYNLFKEVKEIGLTKQGNLLLPITLSEEEEVTKKVIGEPIKVSKLEKGDIIRNAYGNTSLSLNLISKESIDEIKFYALINPFDIISFTMKNQIYVSRFKVYKKEEINNIKGVVEIKNEKLFEISYDIFEDIFKK
jgi:hypothetical protein